MRKKGFQFRWLKIKGIHVTFPISTILFTYYVKYNLILNQTRFQRTIVRLTTSQIAAHAATVIFMINPAGIFFNSCYTESAYFCFFITGFYFLVTEKPNSWMATFCFTIASGIRSNGILNAGFIAHFSIHSVAQAYFADLGLFKGRLSI